MAIAVHVTHADTFYSALHGAGETPSFFSRLFGAEAAKVEGLDPDAVTAALAEEPIDGDGRHRTLNGEDLGLGTIATVELRSHAITLELKPTHPQLQEAWMAMVQVAIRLGERLDAYVWEELTKQRLDTDRQADVIHQAQGTLSTFATIGDLYREKRTRPKDG